MDAFLRELENSARLLSGANAKRAFILAFREAQRDPMERRIELAHRAPIILDAAHRILLDQGLDAGKGADFRPLVVRAKINCEYSTKEHFLAAIPNLSGPLRLGFEVIVTVKDGSANVAVTHHFPTWLDTFEQELCARLADTPVDERDAGDASGPGPVGPTVFGPNQALDASARGYFRDYSGFALEDDVDDLFSGDLPLGCYSFQKPGTPSTSGRRLYLSTYRSTGAPMLHNGVLLCAPQGSGKTQLILRWAEAANLRGYGVFIVDMKGNMRRKLQGRLRGTVRYFSTDPRVRDCDRINFISGMHGTTPEDSARVRQVAEALLPRDGWERGEQAYFHQNHVNWLSGLLHLLLLHARVAPQAHSGEATLGDLYELVADENLTLWLLHNLEEVEKVKGLPSPGAGYWKREIALLLSPQHGGQRSRDYEYRTLTQAAANALRPFSRFGTLHAKTGGLDASSAGLGPVFGLDELECAGDDEPVTIILSARLQDLDDATTVTSLAVRRLQHLLFERMATIDSKTSKPPPILLLLDETRRIPGFKANEYVTFAREAQAGCVVCYQSLDQLGEPSVISEMLENVGTQIYLGSLVGATAKYFIDVLPTRHRRRYSWSTSIGSDYSEGTDVGLEEVPYVSSNELYRLPAGTWPALVYINDQPRRKPFLVDLSNEGKRIK